MTMLTSLAAPLANHLWQSTAFAAIAAVLAAILRKSQAQTRYWLWMAASLKFFVPFGFLMAMGAQVQWRTAPLLMREAAAGASEDLGAPFSAPGWVVHPAAGLSIAGLLPAVWIAGCLAVLIHFAMRWRQAAKLVRDARPLVRGREAEALRRVQVRAGLREPIRIALSAAAIEPGVFGVARQTVLLPAGIAERLCDRQLEAILAHELCHVRRRDNLAAVLHMAVEAVFWFHPLIWWLGARLVEERERACDEEVLRLGGDPKVYAESILQVCEFYLQPRILCMPGVTGGELRSRIERIMRCPFVSRLGFGARLLLAAVAIGAVIGPVLIGVSNSPVALAQAQPATETFEAISIKPANPSDRGSGMMTPPGRMWMRNVRLADCILTAYGIQSYQLAGIPLPTDRYEIMATAHSHPSKVLDARYQAMMQAMLADRFQFKFHRESKVLGVFALEPAKGGTKLKESLEPGLSTRSTLGHLTATGASMLELATYLTRRVGKPVVDLTGLKALYDFKLDWTPAEDEASLEPPDPDHPRTTDPSGGPSLFTALQEQLGLKMTSRRLPVEILVVDRVEKPSEN